MLKFLMMRIKKDWRLTLVTLLTLFLAACSSQAERVWLKSPGWSRAQFIGFTRVGEPISGTVDDQGRVHLFFSVTDIESTYPRLVTIDPGGQLTRDRIFNEIPLERPHSLQVAWDGHLLHLFWIAQRQLFHSTLSSGGDLTASRLVSGNVTVESYDLAVSPAQSLSVWFGGSPEEPGLYAIIMSDRLPSPTLVDPEGMDPDIQYGAEGDLHAVWAHKPPGSGDKPFFYAAYPGGVYLPGRATVAYTLRVVGTSTLEGPRLGLDPGNAYLIWSQQFFSGLEAGTARTQYVIFPKGSTASESNPTLLTIPGSYDLPYQAQPDTPLVTGARVLLGKDFFGGGQYILQLETNAATDRELVTVFHTRTAYLMRKVQAQIGAVYFQDGAPTGYQLLSFTPASSSRPGIFSDQEGHLYLTWLEKGSEPGWAIYFASTAPAFVEGLRGLTLDDIGRISADTIFGLVSGAILVPLALVWVLPALLTLALTGPLRGARETLNSRTAILSIALAIGVLWLVKLGFLPGISGYVPFSAWLPVSPWLERPLQYGALLGITALALVLAFWIERRRDSSSVYVFVLLYAAFDAVLTMAIYGVLIYAAF